MIIAIFGATGRTGRQLVAQALGRGHTIRALVRTSGGSLGASPGVTEVVGDVLDPEAVTRTVAGSDAVLSALGGGPPSAPGVTLSQGMRNIVAAMRSAGARRVVAVANSGILDSPAGGLRMDQPDFADAYRAVTLEHAGTWAALRESDREWTLACAPDIVDGPSTESWDATPDVLPEGGRQISTGNLADFMLDELDAGRFVGTRVGVADVHDQP